MNLIDYYEHNFNYLWTQQVTATEWFYDDRSNSGCDELSITVSPMTPDDIKGPEQSIQVVTEYGGMHITTI